MLDYYDYYDYYDYHNYDDYSPKMNFENHDIVRSTTTTTATTTYDLQPTTYYLLPTTHYLRLDTRPRTTTTYGYHYYHGYCDYASQPQPFRPE